MNYSRHHLRYIGFVLLLIFVSLFQTNDIFAQQNPNKSQLSGQTIFLPVSVTNKDNEHLQDLNKDNFSLFVNGNQQEITLFENLKDEPTSICIIFDVSESMNYVYEDILKLANEFPSRLAEEGNESNEYFLITSGEESNILADGIGKDKFIEQLNNPSTITPDGYTAIFDALSFGIKKLEKAKHKKRAILLITDGGTDNKSKIKSSELKEQAGANGTPIYCLSIGRGYIEDEITSVVEELVERVGGGLFLSANFPRSDFRPAIFHHFNNLQADMAFIINDIRYQYKIGFKDVPSKKDWNKIKLKVELTSEQSKENKRISVRVQKKYYTDSTSK